MGRGVGGGGWGGRNRFYPAGVPMMPYGAPFYGYGYPEPDVEQEKQALTRQAEAMQNELDLLRKRLSEIEAQSAKE